MKRIDGVSRERGKAGAGFFATGSRPLGAAGRDRARNRLKPALVQLEDRQLLATFTVTNTLDTVSNGTPANGTLRWAVQQADLAGGTNTIDFDPSLFSTSQTITLGQLLTPVEMTATAPSITIEGPGAGLLTINANNDGAAFQVDSGVTATISGLTMTGASLGGNGAVDDLGTLNISNCTITKNTISGVYVAGMADITDCTITGDNSYFGAGVFVKGGTADITDCTLSNNTGAEGGGVCVLDANTVQGTATVTDCTISGDSTLGGGGGLYNAGQLKVYGSKLSGDSGSGAAVLNKAGTAYLSGTTISGGSGFIDGGNLNNQYGATLTLNDCTISGGTANSGGGLYNDGKATLTGCTISGNTASGTGGGVANGPLQNKAVLILTDSTLTANTAVGGGAGLYNNGTATVTDSTFTGNFANQGTSLLASRGGGVDNDGTASLVACTISGNTTTAQGGGLYNGGLGPDKMTVNDSIIVGNTTTVIGNAATNDIGVGNGSDAVACSYDLVGTLGLGVIVGGSGDIPVANPSGLGLAPLGNNGGPTETMALLPGSPAIGVGSQALELNPQGQALTTDQRGLPLDTPKPDIGAFQSQGFTLTPVTGSTPQSALIGDPFANPLAVTITAKDTGDPVDGGVVTFTAPSVGASASLSSTTVTVGTNGVAQVTAIANSTHGSYDVIASIAGGATVDFVLTNVAQLSFLGVTGQSITYGTPSVTVGGTLTSGSQAPVGEDVAVKLDGFTQQALIGAGGAFSTTFTNTAGLSVSGSPYKISYSYTSDGSFPSATTTSLLTVTQATPTITWANPADITYGTALSTVQLDATASVPGTFTYTPAAGTVLKAGAGQTLSLSFTPTDTVDYSTVSDTATINVDKVAPTINWAKPADITYGTALSTVQLDATASVPGTFTYLPAAGTVLTAGAGRTLSVTFTPTDATDYSFVSDTTTINVDKATPTINWANPADITYGTALSAAQLDATASVPGTFTYTPATGTVLTVGTNQTLSVAFTPSDTTDYNTAADTATINVDAATPTITWANPPHIIYGTALSAAQLDATASVPGTFTYTPAAGTVLTAGTGQTLSVAFTPSDAADYTTVSATATINVDRAAPTITWTAPADITYGTALSAAQLDATASVPGTFAYTPATAAFLNAGTGQTLSVTFTPRDATDYSTAVAITTIDVDKATPSLNVKDPGGHFDGSPFPASITIAGSGNENAPALSLEDITPTLTYYNSSGATLGSTPPTAAGTYSVVAVFPGNSNYSAVQSAAIPFTIVQGNATIALASSDNSAVYGQSVTFTATVAATASGTPSGTVAFSDGGTLLATVALGGSGKATLTTSHLTLGSNSITATYSGDANFLGVQSRVTSEPVTKAGAQVILVPQPVFKKKKVVSVTLTAEIEPVSPGGGVPTGEVLFESQKKVKKKTKVTTLGTAPVIHGDATLTLKANRVLKKAITIVYNGDTDFLGNTVTPPALTQAELKSLARPMIALVNRGRLHPDAAKATAADRG